MTHSRRCYMKRRIIAPVVAVAVFGLMIGFATVAQAFPSKTIACDNCHSGANIPVTAIAGATAGTTVTYALSAPGADAIAVFDGATKVATLGASGSFSATVGKPYAVYAVAGPSHGRRHRKHPVHADRCRGRPRGPGAQRHLQHDHRQRDHHVGRCGRRHEL